ncbi:hypothetical protein JTE90_029455 [Oedothorax gibbosus]|uniref:SPIN-DOC-like zinc-finger domain-containing protein n=1 Tax=Oedothorax gibbosus TaxID=931172 RepID=A0AAV6V4K4_9ARAC|nr:hypothetical protein JTE90_029455 [Oedothorax gibbosus]
MDAIGGHFTLNHPNPLAGLPTVTPLESFYNTDVEDLDDFEDDIENLSETYNFLSAYYYANNFFVLCKACRSAVRTREIKDHLKKEHGWKVLHPQNWKNTQIQHIPTPIFTSTTVRRNRVVDTLYRRKPGISTQTNSSNYNMKFFKEATDIEGRIKRRTLFSELRRRLM